MDEKFRQLVGMVREMARTRLAEASAVLDDLDAAPVMRQAIEAAEQLLAGNRSNTIAAADVAELIDADEPIADSLGHRRDIYRPTAVSMILRSATLAPGEATPLPGIEQLADRVGDGGREIHERTCWAWAWAEAGRLGGSPLDGPIDAARSLLDPSGPDGALHPQDPDESLDHWTYCELVGLHALDQLSRLADGDPFRARINEVAQFHLYHTQPDHVTEHPWAFAAFAQSPDTRMFALQQIHDVATTREPVVAALILAAAADSLTV